MYDCRRDQRRWTRFMDPACVAVVSIGRKRMTGQSSPSMWLADMHFGQCLDLDHHPGKDELLLMI